MPGPSQGSTESDSEFIRLAGRIRDAAGRVEEAAARASDAESAHSAALVGLRQARTAMENYVEKHAAPDSSGS